jgi:hypothetical protein
MFIEKEFRSSGVQEFRSSGVQEFRSSGVQEFRSQQPGFIKKSAAMRLRFRRIQPLDHFVWGPVLFSPETCRYWIPKSELKRCQLFCNS